MEGKSEVLKITLTGRAPVRVTKADWPVIAEADGWQGSEVQCQARRKWWARVRRHADGRSIVYAADEIGGGGDYAGAREYRAGELLSAGADVPAACLRVMEAVGREAYAEELIAALPAEDLV